MFERTIARLKAKQAELRGDTWGFNTSGVLALVIGVVVSILVGLALLPTIAGQQYVFAHNTTISNASRFSQSGAAISMSQITITLMVITIFVVPAVAIMAMLHHGE